MVPKTMVTRKIISQPEVKERNVKQAAVFLMRLVPSTYKKVGQHQTSTASIYLLATPSTIWKRAKPTNPWCEREREREKARWGLRRWCKGRKRRYANNVLLLTYKKFFYSIKKKKNKTNWDKNIQVQKDKNPVGIYGHSSN